MPRRSQVSETVAERRALVVSLRRKRVTFEEIGRVHLGGVTAQRAWAIYRAAIDAVPKQQVDEHRAEDLALNDWATAKLMAIAENPDVSPRTQVEALSALKGWSERRGKVAGSDAPTQIEATVTETTQADAELAEMIREVQARNAVVEAQLAESA